MKQKLNQQHPIISNLQKIKENGIVVLDGAKGLPTGSEPFISPDYVICIGHRGRIDLMYDDYPDYSEQYTVGVIFPNHSLREVRKTDDYLATLIVVDSAVLNDPMLQIIKHLRYRYESHPCVKLDKHEYKVIMNLVEVMKEISSIQLPDRWKFAALQLEFFLRLLSHYRTVKLNEKNVDKRVSTMFINDLAQHFRQHRDVGFYAEKACLSVKHFSTVIKQETGHTAAYWIHAHIAEEAKTLLHVRNDLSIQEIADMLGFDEQSTFSRYFRRETGLSPTAFREIK